MKMLGSYGSFCCILVFFLLMSVSGLASSDSFISYDALEPPAARSARSLLLLKKRCPVDFEHENYTAMTSTCKGPYYEPKSCCMALKMFGCKFTNEINDMASDCAEIMFYYINLHGRYLPGLFASRCREGPKGLDCDALLPPTRVAVETKNNSYSPVTS